MKIQIWSDISCPFCFIGKRNLEKALEQFEHKDQVQITWKSFELDPSAPKNKERNLDEILARKYSRTREAAHAMNRNMEATARQAGLEFHLDQAIPTNSFDAHRLIQLATKKGLQDAAEEILFSAYLSKGLDIADHVTLVRLGSEIGLDSKEVEELLSGNELTKEVREDEDEAYTLGVQGVPFFLFDDRFAISGAQPSENFLQALRQAWAETHATEAST